MGECVAAGERYQASVIQRLLLTDPALVAAFPRAVESLTTEELLGSSYHTMSASLWIDRLKPS